jgi:hypothetical protein
VCSVVVKELGLGLKDLVDGLDGDTVTVEVVGDGFDVLFHLVQFEKVEDWELVGTHCGAYSHLEMPMRGVGFAL